MPASPLILLPQPRRLQLQAGSLRLSARQRSAIQALTPAKAGMEVRVDPAQIAHPEGYRLLIRPQGVVILAHDAAGAWYAAVTLRQIARQCPRALPCLHIDDHPDFPARGYMLDISRDKVPTFATLLQIVDAMVEVKLNQLQLYTEHTFAYRRHREVWKNASPLTAAEIRRLDAYCRDRHIQLVPNQNSFGHMERWLIHPRYQPLAEAPSGFHTPWDFRPAPTTLSPVEPGSLKLIRELHAEMLPNFTSRLFNVGCDETWDLGQGRSKDLCAKIGKGRVYLNFLREIHQIVASHGRTMMFWGDVILEHPQWVPALPTGVIALSWGYEAHHPFGEQGAKFAASGVPFYVCPGTSAWNSITGRTTNALTNLRKAAEEGHAHGSVGYLITDWGDHGHMQPYFVSLAPLAYGAAACWHVASLSNLQLAPALDAHFFLDPAGVMGRLVLDLGDIHLHTGAVTCNCTSLGRILTLAPDLPPAQYPDWIKTADAPAYRQTKTQLQKLQARLSKTRMQCADAKLLAHEIHVAVALLSHACTHLAARAAAPDRTLAAVPSSTRRRLAGQLRQILPHYRKQWLSRNRPGGLDDSAARLQRWLKAFA